MGRGKQAQQPTVALEVTRTHLLLTVIRPQGANVPAALRCRRIEWRKNATSLATELGAAEFSAALKGVVVEEKIAGCEAGVCLNEEFCVTRIVTGPTDRVRKELAQLEERSSLYLTLGAGPKTHARSLRQIDARHQHALLTVTNKKVLDTILSASRDAGLQVNIVEPVLIGLSRLLNRLGRDLERPVLVVNLSPENFELGISYQGQILLDYRPGGKASQQAVADIVQRHLARLDRYCQRYFRFPSGSLQEIYLCGGLNDVAGAREGFLTDKRLKVEALPLNELNTLWDFKAEQTDTANGGPLGTQLVLQQLNSEVSGPNFMEKIRAEARSPILPGLIRNAWPIAAAILLSVVVMGVAMNEQSKVDTLTAELKTLQPASEQISQMRMKQVAADKKITHLTVMQNKLTRSSWSEMVAALGHCLPDDVWLEGINLQGDGKMQITGAAYGEGGIYEFIRYLQQYPGLSQVALEQTQPATTSSGPATKFDLNCDLAGHNSAVKQEKKQ